MKILFTLSLVASTAWAFVVLPPAPHHATKLHMYDSVEAAIADAQRICADDPMSQECKVAWDIVEELEAADSHKGGVEPPMVLSRSAEYASLVDSLGILMEKTDRKMDQLKALTLRLAEMEATDPAALMRVGALSDEMRLALAEAKASLYGY